MVQYLSGGAWGVVIRRPCEAAARTIPLLALLFLPIAFGIPWLYRWDNAGAVAADAVLAHKHTYLNAPFFLIRAAAYFAGWILFNGGLTTGRTRKTARAVCSRTIAWPV